MNLQLGCEALKILSVLSWVLGQVPDLISGVLRFPNKLDSRHISKHLKRCTTHQKATRKYRRFQVFATSLR